MDIRLAGIISNSIVDGPGIRMTIFTQGCPHRCPGCHNEHTFDFEGGKIYDTAHIVKEMLEDPLLSGVTFSGGEPMMQPLPLLEIAKSAKEHGLNVVMYTGYTFEYLLKENDKDRLELLAYTDILIDGRYEQSKRDLTLKFRGSSNQRILDCTRSLLNKAACELTII